MSSEIFKVMMLASVILLGLIFGVGYRQMRKMQRIIAAAEERVKAQYQDVEIIGSMTYQGGLPQFPKAAVLHLALNKEILVLYDERDFSMGVGMNDVLKVEKFMAREKNHGRSLVMLGPFNALFFKDKLKCFIVIRYIDINHEENNILFELRDKTIQQEIYDVLSEWHSHFRKIKVELLGKMVTLEN